MSMVILRVQIGKNVTATVSESQSRRRSGEFCLTIMKDKKRWHREFTETSGEAMRKTLQWLEVATSSCYDKKE